MRFPRLGISDFSQKKALVFLNDRLGPFCEREMAMETRHFETVQNAVPMFCQTLKPLERANCGKSPSLSFSV
jgi:hypothetical protein